MTAAVVLALRGVYATLLQLGTRLQSLYPPVLAFNLRVGAGEEERNVGSYLVAEGGFCGGKAVLGDELVVLSSVSVSLNA